MVEKTKEMSRRGFLTAGAVTAGTLAVGGSFLGAFDLNTAKAADAPDWPWPYVQLDAKKAAELGYQGYSMDRCSFGAYYGVVSQLQDKIGFPYTGVPLGITTWGATGGAGWATLCGALVGASTAINLVVGPNRKEVSKVVNELFGWYTNFEFPKYMPPAGKADRFEGKLTTTVAGSPLCHISVGKWCDASQYRAESKPRGERCARLTGDVAEKTVELLNAWHNNKFVPAFKNYESVEECMSCHGAGRSLENARGKMDCVQCHTDVNPDDLLQHIKQNWEILK